jgi:hypothetical protein
MRWIVTRTGLVPAEEYCRPTPNRSTLPMPHVMRDEMAPVQSMASGRMYDSKSAIRAEYKRLGLTEVGNDSSVLSPKPFVKPRPDKNAIKAAVGKAFSKAGLGS